MLKKSHSVFNMLSSTVLDDIEVFEEFKKNIVIPYDETKEYTVIFIGLFNDEFAYEVLLIN